jgi:hypothetical protein
MGQNRSTPRQSMGAVMTPQASRNKEFSKWLADWKARIPQSGVLPEHPRPEPLRLTPSGPIACPFVVDATVGPYEASR